MAIDEYDVGVVSQVSVCQSVFTSPPVEYIVLDYFYLFRSCLSSRVFWMAVCLRLLGREGV